MTMKNSGAGSDKKKKEKKNLGLAFDKWQQWQQGSCLKNRTKTLKKKLNELTTLCGIEGFMVILPDDSGQSSLVEPIIWPENQDELLGLIERFDGLDHGKQRKACNSDMGLKEYPEVAFSREQSGQGQKGNSIDGFSVEQLQELKIKIDSLILEVNAKINLLKGKQREVLETGEVGCQCSDGFSHWLPETDEVVFNWDFDVESFLSLYENLLSNPYLRENYCLDWD